jgi:hypothetical protein
MHSNKYRFIQLQLLFGLLIFVGIILTGPAFAGEKLKVNYIKAPALYRTSDQLSWKEITDTSQTIPLDADIIVEKEGAISLQQEERASIQVNEESGFTVNLADTPFKIRLNHGSMKMNVDKSKPNSDYRIQAASASLGIRGTEFGISYEKNKQAEVFVNKGEVEVSSREASSPLKAGEAALVQEKDSPGKNYLLEIKSEIPKRFQLTWNHWWLSKQNLILNRKKTNLQRRIKQMKEKKETPDTSTLKKLEESMESTNENLQNTQKLLKTVRENYHDYRRRLEAERKDFIQKRRQAFNNFRRERIEKMQEMQEEQQKGIEQLRKEREEAMKNMYR